jgi:hypothetical protein
VTHRGEEVEVGRKEVEVGRAELTRLRKKWKTFIRFKMEIFI